MASQNKKLPHSDLGFVFVEGGQFMMGGNEHNNEKPIHSVVVSDFNMCKYPVTQALYEWVTGNKPSHFRGSRRPVENVSWYEAQVFIKQLNEKKKVHSFLKRVGRSKMTFRLPTEAEWEFAGRGGKYSQGYTYCGSDKLKQMTWYNKNSGDKTKTVGLLRPNELGLFDMSGNVWEWCQDKWHTDYENAPKDGRAWEGGDSLNRVMRGGSWYYSATNCRVACRLMLNPGLRRYYIGFRLAFSL